MIKNESLMVAMTPAKPIKMTGAGTTGMETGPVETNPLVTYGTSGDDKLIASASGVYGDPAIVKAGAGNDVVYGSCGVDHLYGGAGHDWMQSWGDHDKMFGGTGNDMLKSVGAFNQLYGGEGNDILVVEAGSIGAHVEGGEGNDSLFGSADGSWFDGGEGNDKLFIANGGADGASPYEKSVYIGGAGWDVAKLETAKFGQDAWIETNQYGVDTLHWFNWAGQEQTDTVYQIEQFDIGGTLYTYDQLHI